MMFKLRQVIEKDFTLISKEKLPVLKRQWSKKIGKTPKNSEILTAYLALVKKGRLKANAKIEKLLQIKSVRSQSGVTPMAVMTKPFYCPGQCIYCPLDLNLPKSYLHDEPAAQRAIKANFNPYKQVKNRIKQLVEIGHDVSKIEFIVIGGTFSVYPENYKQMFFKRIFDACNEKGSASLAEAQKLNESALHRVVGMSIETRPDFVDEKEVKLLRALGVTKIQLGVQAFDARLLKLIKRGHSLKPVAEATRILRNSGFKICYHFMPNLPGSNPQKDLRMAKIMYEDKRYKPDYLKIYPTQVIPNTELYRNWRAGKYQGYDEQTLKEVLKKIKLITPYFVRIDRLVRDISRTWIAEGTVRTNLRQIIQKELREEGLGCQCIRCREIKKKTFVKKFQLKMQKYATYGGREYFLSFENGNNLLSLLRLRLPDKKQKQIFKELKRAAIVREVHTFGTTVAVDKRVKKMTQHQGLGKKLLEKASEISGKNGFKKIAVISAVGTRNYYKKMGFRLEGLYMTKPI